MPANQIQDHSQLRGKSASKDEDDWHRCTLMLTRMRGGGKERSRVPTAIGPRKRGNAPGLSAFGKLASDLLAQR